MEIFKFIKWQWNRFQQDEKALIAMFVVGVISTICCLFYGFKLIGSVVIGVIAFLLAGLVIIAYAGLCNQWRKYNLHKDQEAQRIVDILKRR